MNRRSTILACGLILASVWNMKAPPCSYTLSPTAVSFSSAPTNGNFTVTVGSSCSWSAATTNSWLHTTNTGTGNGTVNYSVDANAAPAGRTGAITVANKTFTVSQAAAPLTLANALDTSNLVWVTASDYPFQGVTNVSHDGVDSAASGNRFVANSTSWVRTTVVGPGILSFWWKVDSDTTPMPPSDPVSFDTFEFLINGVQQDQILGQIDWSQRTYAIPAGTNVLTWQYVKDAQFNSGTDTAWLDQVAYVAQPAIPLTDALDACSATWASGGNDIPTYWFGQTNTTHDGNSAAQSGAIGPNEQSWLQTVVIGVTNVSFWWKVSSQTNYDYLGFYTNGVLAKAISGEVNWQSNFYKLPPATNTLMWVFAKTNFNWVPQGQNCSWVDQVQFKPVDTTPPTIMYSFANLTLSANSNCQASLPDLTGTNYFLAADDCSSVTVTQMPPAGTSLSVGTNQIVLSAVDASGNAASTTNTVEVVDNTAPTVTLLGTNPMAVECHTSFLDPGATGQANCGGVTLTTNGTVNANAPGAYTIRYIASNSSGISTTNNRTVNVVDTMPPTIVYHFTNLTLNAGSNCQASLPDLTGTNYFIAVDNCSSVTVTQMPAAGTLLSLGSNQVILVALDSSGNTVMSTNTVLVADTTPPTIVYHFTNLTLNAGSNCQAALPDLTGTNYFIAVDNCSSVTATQMPAAGTLLSLGSNQVILFAADSSRNTAVSTNTVLVADTTTPMIVYHFTNLILNAGSNCQAALPDLTGTNYFIAVDNCSSVTVTQMPAAGTLLSLGSNQVILAAADSSGNTITSTNAVLVADMTPPMIVYQFTNLTLSAGSNCQASLPDLTGTNYFIAVDNCSSVTVTQMPAAGALMPLGTNQVVLVASDSSGNTAWSTNAVVVLDATPPMLVPPADVVVSAGLGQCSATNVALGSPIVSDNCGIAWVTNNAPSIFPVGTNFVIWTAMDVNSNATTSSQKVIVYDDQAPTLVPPTNLTVSADAGQNYASSVNLGTATAIDNCGVASVTNDAPAHFPIGTNRVTWISIDVHGNTNTASQFVVVNPAPWLPHGISNIARNGDGSWTLSLTGAANIQYAVQVSSNLFNWVSVATNTANDQGASSYIDFGASNFPARFYRSARQ